MNAEKANCPSCGTKNEQGAPASAGCGKMTSGGEAQTASLLEKAFEQDGADTGPKLLDIPERELYPIVGPRGDYYMGVWRKMTRKKVPVSFNFPALFFGPYWLAYRKMIKEAALYVLTGLLLIVSILLVGAKAADHSKNVCGGYAAALLPEAKDAAEDYYTKMESAKAPGYHVVDAGEGHFQQGLNIGNGTTITMHVFVTAGELPRLIARQEQAGEYPFLKAFRDRTEYQKLVRLEKTAGKMPAWASAAAAVAAAAVWISTGVLGNYFYFRKAEYLYRTRLGKPETMASCGGVSVVYLAVFAIALSFAVIIASGILARLL